MVARQMVHDGRALIAPIEAVPFVGDDGCGAQIETIQDLDLAAFGVDLYKVCAVETSSGHSLHVLVFVVELLPQIVGRALAAVVPAFIDPQGEPCHRDRARLEKYSLVVRVVFFKTERVLRPRLERIDRGGRPLREGPGGEGSDVRPDVEDGAGCLDQLEVGG